MGLDRYIDRTYYDAQGHTGNTYYFRIVRRSDSAIRDYTNEEFSTSTTWLNSAHILVEVGSDGQFPVPVPADLPAGNTYDFIIYQQAGAAPANTDDVKDQFQLRHGSDFGF